MIIACPSCSTQYQHVHAAARSGTRARCSQCEEVFELAALRRRYRLIPVITPRIADRPPEPRMAIGMDDPRLATQLGATALDLDAASAPPVLAYTVMGPDEPLAAEPLAADPLAADPLAAAAVDEVLAELAELPVAAAPPAVDVAPPTASQGVELGDPAEASHSGVDLGLQASDAWPAEPADASPVEISSSPADAVPEYRVAEAPAAVDTMAWTPTTATAESADHEPIAGVPAATGVDLPSEPRAASPPRSTGARAFGAGAAAAVGVGLVVWICGAGAALAAGAGAAAAIAAGVAAARWTRSTRADR